MRFEYQTDILPERDRFAYWRDAVCRDLLHLTPEPPADGDAFRSKLDVHMIGRFRLANMESSHGNVEKTASDLALGATDGVLLYNAVGGSQHYLLGPHEYNMAGGDLCIVPMDQQYRGAGGAMASRSVLIPNAVLRPLIGARALTRAHHIAADAPLGVLLGASLNAASTQLPRLTDEVGEAVLQTLSGLVALALGTSDEGREAGVLALRDARLDVVKHCVRRRLSNPMLTPASVALEVGMSVRQVHLLFQPTGGTFTQYVLGRRLEACRATLSNPLSAGRSVADVAFGWGFNSLSVFYRAFGAAFQVCPTSVRAASSRVGRPGMGPLPARAIGMRLVPLHSGFDWLSCVGIGASQLVPRLLSGELPLDACA